MVQNQGKGKFVIMPNGRGILEVVLPKENEYSGGKDKQAFKTNILKTSLKVKNKLKTWLFLGSENFDTRGYLLG